jgi:hypothetical protein
MSAAPTLVETAQPASTTLIIIFVVAQLVFPALCVKQISTNVPPVLVESKARAPILSTGFRAFVMRGTQACFVRQMSMNALRILAAMVALVLMQ